VTISLLVPGAARKLVSAGNVNGFAAAAAVKAITATAAKAACVIRTDFIWIALAEKSFGRILRPSEAI
jgi:hypothetical protein